MACIAQFYANALMAWCALLLRPGAPHCYGVGATTDCYGVGATTSTTELGVRPTPTLPYFTYHDRIGRGVCVLYPTISHTCAGEFHPMRECRMHVLRKVACMWRSAVAHVERGLGLHTGPTYISKRGHCTSRCVVQASLAWRASWSRPVSSTHLPLPTLYSLYIPFCAAPV